MWKKRKNSLGSGINTAAIGMPIDIHVSSGLFYQ